MSSPLCSCRTIKIEQLKARLFNAYKNEIIAYDPNGFPQGYREIFDTAYQNESTVMLETINLGWVQWVTKDEETLQSVKVALEKLTDETAIGDLVKWKGDAEGLRLDTTLKYNGAIDTTYLWTDSTNIKAGLVTKLIEVIAISEQNFVKDEEAIKKLIDAALGGCNTAFVTVPVTVANLNPPSSYSNPGSVVQKLPSDRASAQEGTRRLCDRRRYGRLP